MKLDEPRQEEGHRQISLATFLIIMGHILGERQVGSDDRDWTGPIVRYCMLPNLSRRTAITQTLSNQSLWLC
jgi:hypothetical protein